MVGVEQGGIASTIEFVLKLFSQDDQTRLAANVFVTGGPANLPGLKKRLEKEILAMRPFKSTFNVSLAKVFLVLGIFIYYVYLGILFI